MPARPRANSHNETKTARPLAHDARKLEKPPAPPVIDLSDPDAGPPEEPGISVDALEVGLQFLRDATEQYNFESELRPDADYDAAGPLGQMISDATLESANQADFDLPVSAALSDDRGEVLDEPQTLELDLRSDAIVAASLFDRPVADVDDGEEELEAEDDFAVTFASPMREPQVSSDDPSDVDEARRDEIQRLLDERVKKRLRVDELPAELRGPGRTR